MFLTNKYDPFQPTTKKKFKWKKYLGYTCYAIGYALEKIANGIEYTVTGVEKISSLFFTAYSYLKGSQSEESNSSMKQEDEEASDYEEVTEDMDDFDYSEQGYEEVNGEEQQASPDDSDLSNQNLVERTEDETTSEDKV